MKTMIWAAVLLVIVVIILRARPVTETMQSMSSMSGPSIASQAVSELTTGKIKIGAKSINRVAITEASLVASQPGVTARLFGNVPSHTVVLKARLKYYINGGAIIALGKRFEVRGTGNTTQNADGVARREAATILADVQNTLRTRNLME
jgi:hypothetical protein